MPKSKPTPKSVRLYPEQEKKLRKLLATSGLRETDVLRAAVAGFIASYQTPDAARAAVYNFKVEYQNS